MKYSLTDITTEPSDEQLSQLMKEVAQKKQNRNRKKPNRLSSRTCMNISASRKRNILPLISSWIMHKPVLIIIAGPNGSGKTSITSRIIKHDWMEDSIYINPDNIAQDKFGDWNSVEAVMKAAKYSEELREQCLKERKSLIFETVLSVYDKCRFYTACKGGRFLYSFILCMYKLSLNKRFPYCR